MRRVTIDDIAAELGVSRQTVSRAFNGKPDISDATRERVFEVSERMGYKPSRFAANLARSKPSRTIGFIVESFRNPYYSELVADFLDIATARDWQVAVSSHETTPDLELLERLGGDVDVIVGYLSDPVADIARTARGTPVILMDRTSHIPGVHAIGIDFDAGLGLLIDGLRERGARNIGLLESHDRGKAYEPSTRRLGFEAHVDPASRRRVVVCEAGPQSAAEGAAGLEQLLEQFPETDTVIAFSDLMALGAMNAAARLGKRVPEELRIAGIDGLSLGEVTSPPLTSLQLVGPSLSEGIAEIITRIFAGTAADIETASVVPSPVWRGSA